MAIHTRQHALNASDHTGGTTPSTGEHNVPATNDAGSISEVTVEQQDSTPSSGGKVVRRATDGHVKVPTSGQESDEAISYSQVESMITDGIWKSPVHSAVADHTASSVGDAGSGGPALGVGDLVINTTDEKVYEVTAGSGNGSEVTWDAGTTPSGPHIRLNKLTDETWVYDTDTSAWESMGGTTHSQQHSMTSTSDHTAGNHKLFYSDGSGQVQELALGAANAPLLGGGASSAPAFGGMLIASAVVNAAGATPVDSDVSAWGSNTLGIVVGTGGRVFGAFKNATDVYFVELTAI
jgi:hypothetical protein